MLGYSQWRRFEDAIKRGMISCEKSGNDPSHHFAGAGKMIELGSGSKHKVRGKRWSSGAPPVGNAKLALVCNP